MGCIGWRISLRVATFCGFSFALAVLEFGLAAALPLALFLSFGLNSAANRPTGFCSATSVSLAAGFFALPFATVLLLFLFGLLAVVLAFGLGFTCCTVAVFVVAVCAAEIDGTPNTSATPMPRRTRLREIMLLPKINVWKADAPL